MKVLHVIPSVSAKSGGPSRAIVPLCRSLQAEGIEVVIVTTDEGFPARRNTQSPENFNEVPTFFFPVQLGASFKYSRPLSRWLGANVKNFDVVHIHAIFNHACIAAARICRKYGVPYVVRPLGTLDPWSMKQKPVRKALFWRLVGKRMMEAAAAVHYTAQAEKEATEQSLGLNHGTVVPLGVEVLPPAVCASAPTSYPYVLVLSRLHPKKGLDILIDAFVSVVRQPGLHDWRLVVSGDGPRDYVQSLKRRVTEHQAENSILFTGWLEGDERQATLTNAALLALTSYQENFGLCVMEAMASGVPVMVSPQVNLAGEVAGAGAGWIVPVEHKSLQSALEQALQSEDERRRRGAAGKVLSESFAWPNVAQQLVNLYQAVTLECGDSSPLSDRTSESRRDPKAVTSHRTPNLQITPVIITYNEAPNIARTLDQLRWAHEIVVVDSFSNDETLAILSNYPQVRVLQRRFDNFANQCNYVLEHGGIQTEWVLNLDADYLLTQELINEIAALKNEGDVAGYRAHFTYCINGRQLRSGIYPPVTVLFRKQNARYRVDGHAHKVVVDGPVHDLAGRILHDDRKPLSRWLHSQTKYAELEARKLMTTEHLGRNDRLRQWLVVAPAAVLFYCLVVRGGILDGWPGFYYAGQRFLAELFLSLYLLDNKINANYECVDQSVNEIPESRPSTLIT